MSDDRALCTDRQVSFCPGTTSHGSACDALIRRGRRFDPDPTCGMCGTRIMHVQLDPLPGLPDRWEWQVNPNKE